MPVYCFYTHLIAGLSAFRAFFVTRRPIMSYAPIPTSFAEFRKTLRPSLFAPETNASIPLMALSNAGPAALRTFLAIFAPIVNSNETLQVSKVHRDNLVIVLRARLQWCANVAPRPRWLS